MNALMVQNGIGYAEDDVSAASLNPALVRQARDLKIKFCNDMDVYDRVPRSQLRGKLIQMSWIDIHTGDVSCPNSRSGSVGKEFNTYADDSL